MEKIWDEIEDLAMNFEACQKTLAAIGDETRQHIILEMIRMDYNGSRMPEITVRTNLSRPAVSHHLQILKDAGIVKMRREGRMTYSRSGYGFLQSAEQSAYAGGGNLCKASGSYR